MFPKNYFTITPQPDTQTPKTNIYWKNTGMLSPLPDQYYGDAFCFLRPVTVYKYEKKNYLKVNKKYISLLGSVNTARITQG